MLWPNSERPHTDAKHMLEITSNATGMAGYCRWEWSWATSEIEGKGHLPERNRANGSVMNDQAT